VNGSPSPARCRERQKAGKQLGGKQRPALGADKADPLSTLAAQLQALTREQRAQLAAMLAERK